RPARVAGGEVHRPVQGVFLHHHTGGKSKMKLTPIASAAVCAAAVCFTGTVLAAGDDANLARLGAFKTTGTTTGERIAQEGRYADNIRRVLETITLPEGFRIELFAIAPDARHMAVGRNKGTVWIGTRKSK